MIVEIDIDKMNELKLTPNGWVMLYYLYIDRPCKIGPTLTSILQKQGFLTEKCTLTDKAKDIFKEDVKQLSNEALKEFLLELREHFPKGVKTGGKPVRSAVGTVTINKLKKFFKEYGYSKDIIRQATKEYIANRSKDGYKLMKTFTYFISKQGEDSTLAAYCEMIENGENDTGGIPRIERTL